MVTSNDGSTGIGPVVTNKKGVDMNGWSNRETWAINLHFNPDQPSDVDMVREFVEEELDKLPGWLRDLVSEDINWDEIKEACGDNDD